MAVSNNRRQPYRQQSLFCVRFFILLLLAAISALSVYFYNQLTVLSSQVQQEQTLIHNLQAHTAAQQLIIDRFNQSVTNADVQHKVEHLEDSLQQTEQQMKESLETTTAHIQSLLNTTVTKLDTTVKAAQAEIQNEVNIVKGDVEQYVRTTQDQFSMENSFMIYQLAGTFTILACLISMWHMTGHVRKFRRPHVQRKIMAILWMSPIYGITSWLSLVFPNYEGYLAIIKDFYEAYVIYQFLSFLISVLGRGDRNMVVEVLSHHADHLEPPMRLFGWCRGKQTYPTNRALADAVLMQCQAFTMQFVFFKPMTAVGTFTCNKLEYFGFGTSSGDYKSPQFWFNIIQNISVFIAFNGLIKFYHAVQDDLVWCRPFPKFLCIKGIVFMTFWQGLVISFLANSTAIAGGNGDKTENPEIWGKQAQNFLICLEMLLFSIAHFYCFPTEEWEDGYRPAVEKKMSAGDNLAFGDFVADLKLIVSGGEPGKKKKSKRDIMKVDDPPKSSSPLLAEPIGDTQISDEEEGLMSDSEKLLEGGDSVKSNRSDSHVVDSDLDTSNASMNIEQLQDSIRNSVKEAFDNSDSEVREAASRLLPLMDEIGEDQEDKEYEEIDESHEAENQALLEDPFIGSLDSDDDDEEEEEEEEVDAESEDGEKIRFTALGVPYQEDYPDTSPPDPPISISGGHTYGALYDNKEQSEEQISENDNGTLPNETTSLLGNGAGSEQPDVQLRPSIFTSHL